MSKQDIRDYEAAKRQLTLSNDDNDVLRFRAILQKGLAFHEMIWDDDPEVTAWRRAYMEENPKEFAARFKSFGFLFGKLIASRVNHNIVDGAIGKRVTPDQLAALDLTPEQIEKLAAVNDG